MPVTGEGDDDCDGYQDLYGISAGGGNVWGADDYCYNIDVMQYGVPSSGTVTYNATRRIGSMIPRLNLRPLKTHHAVDPRPHKPRNVQ